MPLTFQETARVLWNRPLGSAYFHMGIRTDGGYGASVPGQFVMLRLGHRKSPLLRRPFSIHRLVTRNGRVIGIELLYKVVGEGTKILSSCREGDRLDMLGPLGNGFSVSDTHGAIFLAAGGIGIAPLLFLSDDLLKKGFDLTRMTLFLGGKSKADLLCKEIFAEMGMTVTTTTDDGSEGDQCYVTHPLETAVNRRVPDVIYACGPIAMLKCVVGIAEQHSISCQISMETTMACGIGVCLGCAVEPSGDDRKYLHACRDGPVFHADRIAM
jgi:dihydroorotate dehydrogenase electron transfer subunit